MVKTKYQTKVQKWRSDSGGEFKSKAFSLMLKERGIEVILSVSHAHQQNRRAEQIICTIMDKSETMRLQACLPASWWQFSFDHATHVYNRTPNRHLNWQTPHQKLTGEVLSIDHLRVLGCAAYVFIPTEVCTNKMAPKSELMIYLGNQPGGKDWIFLRGPNNIVFTTAQATFNETLFPRCPAAKQWNTQLQTPAPSPSSCQKDGTCQCPHSGKEQVVVDDETPSPTKPTPRTNSKGKGKATEPPAPLPPHQSVTPADESEQEKEPEPIPRREPSPPTQRPTRERKVPKQPGNVYSDKHPMDILRKTRCTRDWKEVVSKKSSRPVKGQEREPVPGPSAPPPPPEDDEDEDDGSGESEKPDSEDEIEASLKTDPAPPGGLYDSEDDLHLTRLCQEGGVALSTFLISKAVSPDATEKIPREWTYHDILKLPKSDHKEWRAACEKELETLCRRSVYDLVERPRGRKVIKNCWVFDVKSDSRKRARLVAKGFSQVEGLDYDQVFSPVIRFETVRLILAMAALKNWHMTGFNVRNTYLYGELDEEIYMEQPEGFPDPEHKNHVLRLRRALYGLKQAGLAWW
jgi:hypothetical protein